MDNYDFLWERRGISREEYEEFKKIDPYITSQDAAMWSIRNMSIMNEKDREFIKIHTEVRLYERKS